MSRTASIYKADTYCRTNVMVRFLSEENPFASAKRCDAGVEDAYMYLMQGRGGDAACSDSY